MVRIYRTLALVKSFEIDLLRNVTQLVQCLGLLKQKGGDAQWTISSIGFRIQNTLIPRLIQLI